MSSPSLAKQWGLRLLMLLTLAFVVFGCTRPEGTSEVGPNEPGSSSAAVSSSVNSDSSEVPKARASRRTARDRMREKIPNILLYTQDNEPVRFYEDLVKDKIVLIYFMFTTCQGICPATTTNLTKIQDLLGDRFGRDIFFIGVTLTPEIDTPEVLKKYAEQYKIKAGWTFVTGEKEEIEMLRRSLGVYDPDPVVDADLYSHAGLVTYGNESTGRWSALPGLMKSEQIVEAMLRTTRPRP